MRIVNLFIGMLLCATTMSGAGGGDPKKGPPAQSLHDDLISLLEGVFWESEPVKVKRKDKEESFKLTISFALDALLAKPGTAKMGVEVEWPVIDVRVTLPKQFKKETKLTDM